MNDHRNTDLTNCDREPIHIPESTQPHGCLIVCDDRSLAIRRISANASNFLKSSAPDLIGLHLADVLGEAQVHSLRNALAISGRNDRPALLPSFQTALGTFDVAIHRHNNETLIELEHAFDSGDSSPLALSRLMLSRLAGFTASNTLLQQVPALLKAIIEYDRVMIYQFMPDGSGQVIAEKKEPHLESFLGQFFPASDIPRQARDLYLRNILRIISNASGERVPLVPALTTGEAATDMSFAHLRSVSPIHCEYLNNMGVAASMSISIIIDGELWGLIACHHYAPKTLPMTHRIGLELFGEFLSLRLQTALQMERLQSVMAARLTLDRLLLDAGDHSNEAYLRDRVATFAELLQSDGVGVWIGGVWTASGLTPPASVVPSLAKTISAYAEGRPWSTHQLASASNCDEHELGGVAGLLAIPLSQVPRDYLMFFRKSVIQTLDWAGDPNKTYTSGPLGDRLTPRKSFAIWKETVDGQSKPWSSSDLEIAEAARVALLEVILRQSEVLADERRKADVRQKILNQELNHRVKNILALVRSVVAQGAHGQSIDEYVADLKGRIVAIASAHDQIVRSDGGGNLRELIASELMPFGKAPGSVHLEGPVVRLDARAYAVMALVIHEMATNAAKYGSLSRPAGRVVVTWSCDAGDCEVTWAELGGPEVRKPERRGFGSVLIERSIPFDLNGISEIAFNASGLTARFVIPKKFVERDQPSVAETANAVAAPIDENPLTGLNVLLVEDQLVIAMDAEVMLAELGAASVASAATAAEGLAAINGRQPDIAVLDVNLGSGTSFPVAEELAKRNIRFIFATGYGESAALPPSLSNIPIVKKPYDQVALASALSPLVTT